MRGGGVDFYKHSIQKQYVQLWALFSEIENIGKVKGSIFISSRQKKKKNRNKRTGALRFVLC